MVPTVDAPSNGTSRMTCMRASGFFRNTVNVMCGSGMMGTCTLCSAIRRTTRGLGRMRHLEVKDFWMQGLVRDGRLKVAKVRGDRNPADVLAKYHDRGTLERVCALGGFRVVLAEGVDRAEGGC